MTLVQGLTGPFVYLAIGGFALAESAAFLGLVVPGETAMLLGGALAALGTVSLPIMIGSAVAGAILGDLVGYALGRQLGPRVRAGRWGRAIGPQRWDRAEDLIRHRGPLAVFLGRWVGVLRALVPVAAGASGMPIRRFLLWNVLGGGTWATTVLLLGYLAGSSWTAVQNWLGPWAVVTSVLTIAVVAVPVVRRLRRQRAGAVVQRVPVGVAAASGS